MKIVIAEKIAPAAVELFKEEARWTVVTHDQLDGKLAQEVADADALIVRSAVQADDALLQHARQLRVIGRAGVGVDNIDLDAATKKGIAVMNTPGANAVAVAEHTIGLMLALARHIPRADALTRAGKWEKKSLQGTELRSKTLGIVGLGRIGLEVARRAAAFQMKVIAYDPFVSTNVAHDAAVRLSPLDELYAAADYITLHLALTPESSGMINAAAIKKMRKGVRLVNCARGELLDETAVAAALRSGHIAAVGVDVFTEEPPRNSPLLALDNVIATPHIGGSTKEAQDAVGYQIAVQVKEYLKNGVIQNAVNVPSVTEEEYAQMRPYITLAERLGSFLAQVTEGNLAEISVSYSGQIADWKTELIRNAAIMGVLNHTLAAKANVVNAASIATERGIAWSETKKMRAPTGGAGNVLSLLLRSVKEQHLANGAVLHGQSPRLLGIDGIDVEAPLERNLIFLRNRDVPGVIGKVGTILGKHDINIANFSLGRREQGRPAEAVCVVHVDSKVPDNVLAALRKIDAVTQAKAVRL